MNPLEQAIGYKFSNALLLAQALTHSSISVERKDYPFDNQRLEFLGDSVLQLVITEELFRQFSDFTEGKMTKMRARLVSRVALEKYAKKLKLGEYLMMGKGEEISGGRSRSSNLADSFEALIGSIYLDGGIIPVKKFILNITDDDFKNTMLETEDLNPKGKLQEILQLLAPESPIYELLDKQGPEHSKIFHFCVYWKSICLGEGIGYSKKTAQVAAAHDALNQQLWKNIQ